jgi:hypothetical protein
MRLALTYCLLKIPAKTGNPSSFLPSDSDEAVVGLDIFIGGFKLWSTPVVRDARELSFGDAAHS